jgi:hypothetical protein
VREAPTDATGKDQPWPAARCWKPPSRCAGRCVHGTRSPPRSCRKSLSPTVPPTARRPPAGHPHARPAAQRSGPLPARIAYNRRSAGITRPPDANPKTSVTESARPARRRKSTVSTASRQALLRARHPLYLVEVHPPYGPRNRPAPAVPAGAGRGSRVVLEAKRRKIRPHAALLEPGAVCRSRQISTTVDSSGSCAATGGPGLNPCLPGCPWPAFLSRLSAQGLPPRVVESVLRTLPTSPPHDGSTSAPVT